LRNKALQSTLGISCCQLRPFYSAKKGKAKASIGKLRGHNGSSRNLTVDLVRDSTPQSMNGEFTIVSIVLNDAPEKVSKGRVVQHPVRKASMPRDNVLKTGRSSLEGRFRS
jgi:hypothetical protein